MDINFKGITPLVGKSGSLTKVQAKLIEQLDEEYPNYILQDATKVYKNRDKTSLFALLGQSDCFSRGSLAQAAKEGEEIGFLITGKDVKDAKYKHPGWASRAGSYRYINNDIIPLDNLSDAVQKMVKLIKSKF